MKILFVAGMAAAVVTVIASSRLVAVRKQKRRMTWVENSFPTAFRILRLQSADGRTPKKRHRYSNDYRGLGRAAVNR